MEERSGKKLLLIKRDLAELGARMFKVAWHERKKEGEQSKDGEACFLPTSRSH
jgi:hypothetical protein